MPIERGYKESMSKIKTGFHLIPAEWVWALADLLTKGAQKYSERNWERGMSRAQLLRAAKGHINKFEMGHTYDEETGTHELVSAAWNCLVLFSHVVRGIGKDDIERPKFVIPLADPAIKYEDIKNVLPKEPKHKPTNVGPGNFEEDIRP